MNKKIKVLLVDDDANFISIIKERVVSWGYACLVAANGQEALEIINKEEVDIVVLDYMMPVMHGLSTLHEIRKINSDIPVIMFTGYPDGKVLLDAKKMRVSAFLPKLNPKGDVAASLQAALRLIVTQYKKKRERP